MTVCKTFGAGIDSNLNAANNKKLIQYINLKLVSLGYPYFKDERTAQFLEIATPLLDNFREKSRVLSTHLSPIGTRIQNFLDDYLNDVPGEKDISLPPNTLILDTIGLARIMSLPPNADIYETDIVKSYRTAQGILHNPKEDKRTTKGVFHICEGGLPIPDDKKAVPKLTFTRLIEAAFNPPSELKILPYTASQQDKAELFVSLLLRPIVVPEVPGVISEKTMEVRFYAPGNLVGNLDFVESIFGNAGDPHLPENDAALDAEGWTGHTGCVILATHLVNLKKKDLGLPHYDDATARQRRDGMCWKDENEKYNDGNAFKITARDERGVVVTIIADNYFGYCKKEVKTQISYSANLYGLCEEEHSGGALAFSSYDLGERFQIDSRLPTNDLTFGKMVDLYGEIMELFPEGYGRDKKYNNIVYVPEDAHFNLFEQSVTWSVNGQKQLIKLLPQNYYILPSGYKIQMKKRLNGHHWHLVGTNAEGTFCHKPCTVSGGGKSEISKSIQDAMIQGSVIISDFQNDFDLVDQIIQKDYSTRFKEPMVYNKPPRTILDSNRSLGSVIKLLTPSEEYSDEYNEWLRSVPQRIKDLVYIVKRRYHSEWTLHWREYFSVDTINGMQGNELKFQNRKLISNYLRVGTEQDNSWRIFQLRQDYYASQKVQMEDDISASIILNANQLEYLNPDYENPSVKIVANCEARLFQRPDDCIHKGYDKQGEKDISSPNTFLSNFEPLTRDQVQEIKEDTIGFDHYTQPVKDLIDNFLASDKPKYLVVPSEARLVKGVPSQNPRYLQIRPDITNPVEKYLAETCTRIYRMIPLNKPLFLPVNSVLPGRRNNPAEPKINVPTLAVFNPIHYQELPELFIDFICSITGKSPSTTGFGSEGALTKGPFNSLLPSSDLNNALLSYILTGYEPLSSAAGYVGPKFKVDHDVSLLMPELISRMSVKERDPRYLIGNGYLEKIDDFIYEGEEIEASTLGCRITIKFVHHFLGRIFSNPDAIFTEEMLRPELQDMKMFVDSLKNLTVTQKRVAEGFMLDGTFETLCPPLQALVTIMINGNYEGKDRNHPEFRKMFTREYVINSDWYKKRLEIKQLKDIQFWSNNIVYLEGVLKLKYYKETSERLNLPLKLEEAKQQLEKVQSLEYLQQLVGTMGADPLKQMV
jgi:phosphoenolpyruvate carboxykinase (diphosphate)